MPRLDGFAAVAPIRPDVMRFDVDDSHRPEHLTQILELLSPTFLRLQSLLRQLLSFIFRNDMLQRVDRSLGLQTNGKRGQRLRIGLRKQMPLVLDRKST